MGRSLQRTLNSKHVGIPLLNMLLFQSAPYVLWSVLSPLYPCSFQFPFLNWTWKPSLLFFFLLLPLWWTKNYQVLVKYHSVGSPLGKNIFRMELRLVPYLKYIAWLDVSFQTVFKPRDQALFLRWKDRHQNQPIPLAWTLLLLSRFALLFLTMSNRVVGWEQYRRWDFPLQATPWVGTQPVCPSLCPSCLFVSKQPALAMWDGNEKQILVRGESPPARGSASWAQLQHEKDLVRKKHEALEKNNTMEADEAWLCNPPL